KRQTGNAGIVDEHVEPAKRRDRVRHHALDFGAARHIAAPDNETWDFLRDRRKRFVVIVTDEGFCAVRRKGACKFAADAGCAGRYQYALRHDPCPRSDHRAARPTTGLSPEAGGIAFTHPVTESANVSRT